VHPDRAGQLDRLGHRRTGAHPTDQFHRFADLPDHRTARVFDADLRRPDHGPVLPRARLWWAARACLPLRLRVRFDFLGNFVGVLAQAALLTIALSVVALLGGALIGMLIALARVLGGRPADRV